MTSFKISDEDFLLIWYFVTFCAYGATKGKNKTGPNARTVCRHWAGCPVVAQSILPVSATAALHRVMFEQPEYNHVTGLHVDEQVALLLASVLNSAEALSILEDIRGFPQTLQANAWLVTRNSPRIKLERLKVHAIFQMEEYGR
jgi:hypothetical protein